MATTVERQYPLIAVAEFDYDELPTGDNVEVVSLPPGAIVIGGFATSVVADNGGTSVVLDVGDEDDDDRYVTDLDIRTAAGVTEAFESTVLGRKYPSGGVITAKRVEGGTASSAGTVRIVVEYVIDGRANEVQAA